MATLSMSRPAISSPLASGSCASTPSNSGAIPKRNTSFPCSRAIRPFPTISTAFISSNSNSGKPNPKAVKLIVPPSHQKATFVLNLTQAEFSRQD